MVRPIEAEGQRASALRFGDRRIQALFSILVLFSLQARGFTHSDMRALLAQLLGLDPAHYPQGRMSYDLRRLRLHGLVARIPRRHPRIVQRGRFQRFSPMENLQRSLLCRPDGRCR